MTAIAAAAMRVRTMADGSLRIEVEVSPMDAQAAFALFGKPGTQMGLAALKDGYGAASSDPNPMESHQIKTEPPKPPIGPLCKLAVQWCKEEDFQLWCYQNWLDMRVSVPERWFVSRDGACADYVRAQCLGIKSRRMLDEDKNAAFYFHERIREPYMEYLIDKDAQ